MVRDQSWFDDARFGMFIHWSHCSQAGLELSWPMVGGVGSLPGARDVSVAEYEATAATFDPRPGAARQWADLAKRAGMRYAVMGTKHHDGFAMFDSKVSDYSVMQAACGRDLVREFVEAFREAGLRVGFYYSLSDWHHPDYPAWTDADRPYRFGRGRRSSPEAWERYLAYLDAQLEELLTGYGEVDVLWFDGGWERSAEEWRSGEIAVRARQLQPGILINDRLPGEGDFDTPEQFVPAQPPARRWETCQTMNGSWGYVPEDTAYKSSRELVHALCETASRGGNLLLNVSPRADGSLPPEQVERLEAVAGWMAANGESVIATRPGLEPWQFYGTSTRRGSTFYLHCLMRPYEVVTVRGIQLQRVRSVRHVASGAALEFATRMSALDRLVNRDPVGEVHIEVPSDRVDEYATVLAIEIAEE